MVEADRSPEPVEHLGPAAVPSVADSSRVSRRLQRNLVNHRRLTSVTADVVTTGRGRRRAGADQRWSHDHDTAHQTTAPAVAAVRSRAVTKDFGVHVHAVRGIDLELQQGEIVAFLGPNGAGKTTTIDMILGPLPAHDRRPPRCSASSPARRSPAASSRP